MSRRCTFKRLYNYRGDGWHKREADVIWFEYELRAMDTPVVVRNTITDCIYLLIPGRPMILANSAEHALVMYEVLK